LNKSDLMNSIPKLLEDIQSGLFEQAKAFRDKIPLQFPIMMNSNRLLKWRLCPLWMGWKSGDRRSSKRRNKSHHPLYSF